MSISIVKEEMLKEKKFLESNEEKARRIRPFQRANPDGGHSSHIMRHEKLDNGEWVAFPTLFYDIDEKSKHISWKDMSFDEDWFPAYKEAEERDEVFKFSSMEDAENFALGGWKIKEK